MKSGPAFCTLCSEVGEYAFMRRQYRSIGEPTPLVWQPSPEAAGEPVVALVHDVAQCSLCKAWTTTCCQTIEQMRSCRNLDEDDLVPVPLLLA